MFPRGNREGTNAAMSLYLNAADADTAPLGWMRRASFKLTVVNHLSPEQSFTKRKRLRCFHLLLPRLMQAEQLAKTSFFDVNNL